MAKALRQCIEIPIGENAAVAVDVTFRILEIVESRYDMRAELVARLVLQNDAAIKRTDIARVICDWLAAAAVQHDRMEVYEAVITAPDQILRRYVGCIQGAIAYSLKEITVDELRKLERGENLTTREKKSEDPDPPSTSD